MDMTSRQWIDQFCEALGVPSPSDDDVSAMLEVAAVAAHASHRTAAPVSCWLAASAGLTPDAALAVASRLAGSASEV